MLLDSASHKLISIVFACFVLFLAVTLNMNVSQANPLQEGPANKNSHEQFLQLFDYEIQNRA